MKYVYYDPTTMQVMAQFDTPNLSDQQSWVAQGLSRALVPPGMRVGRDHKIDSVDGEDFIITVTPSVNPIQPTPRIPTRLNGLHDKLADDSITDGEIREMLRLERW